MLSVQYLTYITTSNAPTKPVRQAQLLTPIYQMKELDFEGLSNLSEARKEVDAGIRTQTHID